MKFLPVFLSDSPESDAIHKSVIVQEIKNLQQKIIETVQKIDSVQKEAGTS